MKFFAFNKKFSFKSLNTRLFFTALAFFVCQLAAQNAAANYVVTRVNDRNNPTCAAGETYVLPAEGKPFTFSQPAQTVSADADVTNAHFIAV